MARCVTILDLHLKGVCVCALVLAVSVTKSTAHVHEIITQCDSVQQTMLGDVVFQKTKCATQCQVVLHAAYFE